MNCNGCCRTNTLMYRHNLLSPDRAIQRILMKIFLRYRETVCNIIGYISYQEKLTCYGLNLGSLIKYLPSLGVADFVIAEAISSTSCGEDSVIGLLNCLDLKEFLSAKAAGGGCISLESDKNRKLAFYCIRKDTKKPQYYSFIVSLFLRPRKLQITGIKSQIYLSYQLKCIST